LALSAAFPTTVVALPAALLTAAEGADFDEFDLRGALGLSATDFFRATGLLLGDDLALACAMVLSLLVVPVQFSLAVVAALFVELSLYLCPPRALLGDRGLGATLLGMLAVVACIVVLGLGLNLGEPALAAGTANDGYDNREDDQGADDYGDDCDGGHRSSFGLRLSPNARLTLIETTRRRKA